MGIPYVGPAPSSNGDVATKAYTDTKYVKPDTGIPSTDFASSVQTTLVNRGYDAIVIANGSDQSDEFQSKLDAMPEGGTLLFTGQVRISKPIVGRRNKTIMGQMAPRWSYQTTPVTSIRPTSGFSGLAAILIPDHTIVDSSLPAMSSARSDYNDNGRLINVVVDCSAISPGGDRGIYGIFLEGLVRNWQLLNVGSLSARGIGIAMSQGRGTANPRGITAEHVQAVYSKNVGIYLAYTTDSHLVDLLAVGGEVDGQVHLGCAETHFEDVRSVFNKGRGIVLGGSRSIANAVHYGSITTDRNAFDGLAVEQSGTFPLFIDTAVLNRDGSASTTADYAALTLGDTTSRIAPVNIAYLSVVPGVDDPTVAGQPGAGNYSPQHVVRLGNTTRIKIDTRMGWSAGDPILDKGNHSNTPYVQYDYLRSTSDGTVIVSQISKGDTGAAGPANSLSIGTVNTGAVGSSASASITGTAPNQTLNLTLPTGATGSTGASGPSNTLAIGTVTTGAAGSSASASITGTSPNQTLNLTIPQGLVGNNGTTYTNTATSDTNQSINTGSKTFYITGVGGVAQFLTGQYVRVAQAGSPGNYLEGTITGVGGGAITINATVSNGSGTDINSWNIYLVGRTGATGSAGPANTLSIGTVSTGAAGASATASITGSSPNQTLNLSIPQGVAGVKGDTGATGATGPANTLSIGTVSTGAVGSSASASITGTAPNQTLNLTLPIGATGAAGPANSLSVGTVTTGAAGSSASASISGTAPNQTLNLTIPQGVAGAAGTNGTNGTTYTMVATSTSSVAIGLGSKTFVGTGVGGTPNYQINQTVRIYNTSTPQNYMQGLITATSANSITVNVTETGGSGTIANWTIVPAGTAGTQIFVLAPGDADPTASSPAGFYFRRTA